MVLEKQLQAMVLELALLRRWLVYHTHDSRSSQAGYPDLTLVRERVVFAELKRVGQKPRASQVDWLDRLAAAGAEVYVWTIDDFDEVGRVLAGARPDGAGSAWLPSSRRSDAG